MHIDDAYHYGDSDYCSECYHDICNENTSIKEYSYKPEPIFYGDNSRYFGVELEIDVAGKDCEYADELLNIANEDKEHIYIKSDGSLNDGMEIVTHPMTLDYHKDYCWEEIMKRLFLWDTVHIRPVLVIYIFMSTRQVSEKLTRSRKT